MQTTVCLLLFLCSCSCLGQEADIDILRLSRRVPDTLGEKQINQINSMFTDSGSLSPQRTYMKSLDDIENERRKNSPMTYKVKNVNGNENQGRTHSIGTVTVQLQLEEKPTITSIVNKDQYDDEEYTGNHETQKKDMESHPKDQHDLSHSDGNIDASNTELRYVLPPDSFFNDLRQQNEFLQNNYNLLDKNVRFSPTSGQVQFFSSPASVSTPGSNGPSGQSDLNSQYTRNAGTTVQIVAPPSQSVYSNQPSRVHYISEAQQYPRGLGSQLSIVSTPAPSLQKVSSNHQIYDFLPNEQSSNIQYISTPAPSVQFISSSTPSSRFIEHYNQYKPEESIQQYVSTPAPNSINPSVTPSSFYVSTSNRYVTTTPSPIQYSTSGPLLYGAKLNSYQNQVNRQIEKQMHIDHFDNAISGVRNPKYIPPRNVYISTTPGPLVVSTTAAPNTHEKHDSINWRTHISSLQNNNYPSQTQTINNYQSQSSYQPQPTPINDFSSQQSPIYNSYQSPQPTPLSIYRSQQNNNNNYQSLAALNNYQSNDLNNQNRNQLYINGQQTSRQYSNSPYQSSQSQPIPRDTLFINELDAANNLMIKALHQNYIGEKQHIMKTTYHRDVDKDIETAPTKSYSPYGWKLNSNKRGSVEITQEPNESVPESNSGVYTFSSPTSEFTSSQTATQQKSRPVVEYRPYPENPFLSHISFATSSPPLNSGSIQTINFQPDKNEQQNVNVGYSIGFGNQPDSAATRNQQFFENKYQFNDNPQTLTTISSNPSTVNSDVVKGVHVSQVSAPEKSVIQKFTNENKNTNNDNDLYKNTKHVSFGPSSNQLSFDNNFKSSSGSKTSEVPSGKIFQYFINTPVVKPQKNILTSFNNEDFKNQINKWSNLGAGVEVSSSPNVEITKQIIRESPSPNSIIFLNQDGSRDGGNSYFYPPQKDNNIKVIHSFDHENAMRNIQPIGLSNVVSQSSSLGANAAVVTISPSHPFDQSSRNNNVQDFSQNIVQAPQNSFSTPSPLGFRVSETYNNLKSFDQDNNKQRNVYNFQSVKPAEFQTSENNEIRSYIFRNPNNLNVYESPQNNVPNTLSSDDNLQYAFKADTRPQSTNSVESRYKEYTPSETFRQQTSKTSYHSQSNNEQNLPQFNKIPSDEYAQKNQANEHLTSKKYGNPFYFNQNLGVHNMDPNAAASESVYQLISTSNKQQGNNKDYDQPKEIGSDNKVVSMHGMKVANPYNVNLKILSDLIQGKAVMDDSKLDMSNMRPIELDTSLLRELISRNEQAHYELSKDSEDSFPHFEYYRSPRRKAIGSDIIPMHHQNSVRDSYGEKNEVPEFDQNDYDEQTHSMLRSHNIGAVVDQPGFIPSQRSSDDSMEDDLNEFTIDDDFVEKVEDKPMRNTTRRLKLHNDKQHQTDLKGKSEMHAPYPLLQPPRPSIHRSQKKSDRQPVVPRIQSPHHNIVSKPSRDSLKDNRNHREVRHHKPLFIVKTEMS